MKQKGVVATLGGATSSASQRLADKRANAAAQETQQARLASRPKPRRAAVSKKLGGASAPAASDREAMRAARLAALERRGL